MAKKFKTTDEHGNIRDESNTGFAAYIGKKRVAWALSREECILDAVKVLKAQPTHRRFVPTVTIFDCGLILNVSFITDDANGITVHNRNAATCV